MFLTNTKKEKKLKKKESKKEAKKEDYLVQMDKGIFLVYVRNKSIFSF